MFNCVEGFLGSNLDGQFHNGVCSGSSKNMRSVIWVLLFAENDGCRFYTVQGKTFMVELGVDRHKA